MIRLLAIVSLCLSAAFVVAKDDYTLGPDSMEQPGVPKGETSTFKWDSNVFKGTSRDVGVYIVETRVRVEIRLVEIHRSQAVGRSWV